MREGLIQIQGCDNPERLIDVVFVHGLDGDALTTWQHEKPENYWPKWLADDVPQSGVWSLGYLVSSSAWKGTTMPLMDRAVHTLHLLELDGFGARPIVFVCHSLGGLLIKQVLRHANDFGESKYLAIAQQTRGIVFLSTPHSGSNVANWMRHIGHLLRTTVSVQELQAHDPNLRGLNTWFRNHPQFSKVETLVYCERKPMAGFLVVDETSADPSIKGVTAIPVDEDHISICKPKARSSPIYRSVLRLVKEVAASSGNLITPPNELFSRYIGVQSVSRGDRRNDSFEELTLKAKEKIISVGVGMTNVTHYAIKTFEKQSSSVEIQFLMLNPKMLRQSRGFCKSLEGFLKISDIAQKIESSFFALKQLCEDVNARFQGAKRASLAVYDTIPTNSVTIIDPESTSAEMIIEFFLYQSGNRRPRLHVSKCPGQSGLFDEIYRQYSNLLRDSTQIV